MILFCKIYIKDNMYEKLSIKHMNSYQNITIMMIHYITQL
ncbi:hypothetical protein BTW14_gp017 [BeAn 58058 virus]|nr:hypothetical protein BTW14_gp017 [BeAn 58058 virus]APG58208.1 hypothetical protein BAV00019 [BeAn 58058 virus]